MDKQAKARKHQVRHTWQLRTTLGTSTILGSLATSWTTSGVYRNLMSSFWVLADSERVPLRLDRDFDNLLCDWADREFLNGEDASRGEKLLAALARWALVSRGRGVLTTPRFRAVLRSWKRNAPRRSRLPMPESFSWAIAGYLGHAGFGDMALFQVALFESLLRPSALLGLRISDVVPPAERGKCYVLLVSPFEQETSTKTGGYDETTVLDGDSPKELGRLLHGLCTRRRREEAVLRGAAVADEEIRLWNFTAREFFAAWKAAVTHLQLEGMETVYQARHGGASRDHLVKGRSALEIQLRLHHASASGTRIYMKPGRIQQVVRRANPLVLLYAGRVQRSFVTSLRSSQFPPPPPVAARRRR